MLVTKQEGTVEFWPAGGYFPRWVFRCDIPVDPGSREMFHEKRLEKLERGIYCQAEGS